MNELQKHSAKLMKPDTKYHIIWSHLYEMSRTEQMQKQKINQYCLGLRDHGERNGKWITIMRIWGIEGSDKKCFKF